MRALHASAPVLVLVALDGITKFLASRTLPLHEEILLTPWLGLLFVYNRIPAIVAVGKDVPVNPAFAALGLTAALIAARMLHLRGLRATVLCICAYVLGWRTGIALQPWVHAWDAFSLYRFMLSTIVVTFTTIWLLTARWEWRLPSLLIASAALGNLLSLSLPPYAVVDFIYVPSAGYSMNVADLLGFAGMALLCIAPVVALIRLARGRRAKPSNTHGTVDAAA